MTLYQECISYQRVQSKRAVLQEVMLIDFYSCSCPMLVMLLCTWCELANDLICMILCHVVGVRAAFVFLIQVKEQTMPR